MRANPSPVKLRALERRLPIFQPEKLVGDAVLARLREAQAQAMVVVAYGMLLPVALLDMTRHGAINIHASLLPRWRGAAPIQHALLAGDQDSGVSIMRMDAGLDTGPLYLQRRIRIEPREDFGSLHDRLAALGADALLDVLTAVAEGRARAMAQARDGATYAHKIDKMQTRLRWQRPAEELERAVRAFSPAPGAFVQHSGESVKIWRSRVVPGEGPPGLVLRAQGELHIACGTGALCIEELQPRGRRRMSAAEFLRGRRIGAGEHFQ
jgi:methionyl-tRNA formyltransferase